MPVYEYRCSECRAEFEELIRAPSGAEAAICCPICGSGRVVKQLSVFGVGSGELASPCSGGTCPVDPSAGGGFPPCRGAGGCLA